MSAGISRRDLIARSLLAGIVAPSLASLAGAADAPALTPLDPKDPNASALSFVAVAATAAANPAFKPGQHCAACVHYQGKPSASRAGCDIYAGHSVPAGGWCLVWTQRPA